MYFVVKKKGFDKSNPFFYCKIILLKETDNDNLLAD